MKRVRSAALMLGVLALAACQDATQPLTDSPALSQAAGAGAIHGQYIVVFNDAVSDAPGLARSLSQAHGGTLLFTYEHAIKGFAAQLPAQAVDALSRNPNVSYVEEDREAQLFGTQPSPPSWGLDRVDQRDTPLNLSYSYANGGAGVNLYVLDTGIRKTHSEFGGRAAYVPNGANGDFVGDRQGRRKGAEDCHGHGTHVAGTAGGASYGMAKAVSIWSARVVDCRGSGSVSMAIAAVDWVTGNGLKPAVVNMSLGYGNVQSLRTAVENSVTAGYNYAVAAGNGDFFGTPQNACTESPAGAPNALTVGATSQSDSEASFSNYGACVDVLAPGVSITSAWYTADNATNTISGTSMATPHVAGAVALYLNENPAATPSQVAAGLTGNGTAGTINLHASSLANGTPNLFLYTGFITGGTNPNTPPSASFSQSCTDLTCTFTDGSTDSDGSVASWSWTFGDGEGSTAQNPTHSYAAAGSYTVTLTVTDNEGATGAASKTVTVPCVPKGKSGNCK